MGRTMLILTRRMGEALMIGTEVTVTEVYDRVQMEKANSDRE